VRTADGDRHERSGVFAMSREEKDVQLKMTFEDSSKKRTEETDVLVDPETQVAGIADAAGAASGPPSQSRPRKPRGFAAMDRKLVSQIASKGGKAAHKAGTAHEFTSDEARVAGKKGGAHARADQTKAKDESPPPPSAPSAPSATAEGDGPTSSSERADEGDREG
jgi:general stress protein YciG